MGRYYSPPLRRKRLRRKGNAAEVRARHPNIILWVRVALTFVLLPPLGFIVLSKNDDTASKNFAFTTIGTILGYWLSATPK